MNILMSVNKRFLKIAEEMIFSALYYSSQQIDLYLMYQESELDEKDLEYISKFVSKTGKGKLIPIKFDTTSLDGMPVTDDEGYFFSMETYSRLFAAFKLPKKVNKLLYLDADMVCTGDLKELYDIPLEGNTYAAARDFGIKKKDLERLNLPEEYPYINAGVLLMDIEKIRKNYKEEDIVRMIRENHKILTYLDQDFINKFFAGDIKIIASKYNLLAKSVKYKELKEKPIIIHYAGSVKPWEEDVSRFEKELVEPYYEALRLQKGEKEKVLEELQKLHKLNGYGE